MKVMQCWDDAFSSDVPLVSLLRKYNTKATFNIPTGDAFRQADGRRGHKHLGIFWVDSLSHDECKELYKGFRIGGHSQTHPNLCLADEDTLRYELVDSRDFIREFYGEQKFGFAYPGGFFDNKLAKAVNDAGYLYGRTTKKSLNELNINEPMLLAPHCNFQDEDFWEKYNLVRASDGVFYFWGHSFQMMDKQELWDDFERKLAHIQADTQAEWIDVSSLYCD